MPNCSSATESGPSSVPSIWRREASTAAASLPSRCMTGKSWTVCIAPCIRTGKTHARWTLPTRGCWLSWKIRTSTSPRTWPSRQRKTMDSERHCALDRTALHPFLKRSSRRRTLIRAESAVIRTATGWLSVVAAVLLLQQEIGMGPQQRQWLTKHFALDLDSSLYLATPCVNARKTKVVLNCCCWLRESPFAVASCCNCEYADNPAARLALTESSRTWPVGHCQSSNTRGFKCGWVLTRQLLDSMPAILFISVQSVEMWACFRRSF